MRIITSSIIEPTLDRSLVVPFMSGDYAKNHYKVPRRSLAEREELRDSRAPTTLQYLIYKSFCQIHLDKDKLIKCGINILAMRYVLACMHKDIRSMSGYKFRISDFIATSKELILSNLEAFQRDFLYIEPDDLKFTTEDVCRCLNYLNVNGIIDYQECESSEEIVPNRHKILRDLFEHVEQ